MRVEKASRGVYHIFIYLANDVKILPRRQDLQLKPLAHSNEIRDHSGARRVPAVPVLGVKIRCRHLSPRTKVLALFDHKLIITVLDAIKIYLIILYHYITEVFSHILYTKTIKNYTKTHTPAKIQCASISKKGTEDFSRSERRRSRDLESPTIVACSFSTVRSAPPVWSAAASQTRRNNASVCKYNH